MNRSLKRDVELDTPGFHKTKEKVYSVPPDRFMPKD